MSVGWEFPEIWGSSYFSCVSPKPGTPHLLHYVPTRPPQAEAVQPPGAALLPGQEVCWQPQMVTVPKAHIPVCFHDLLQVLQSDSVWRKEVALGSPNLEGGREGSRSWAVMSVATRPQWSPLEFCTVATFPLKVNSNQKESSAVLSTE